MCVVLQHDLGKGDATLSRCIPLAVVLLGYRPLPAPLKRFAVSSLAGRLRSPLHPIDQGAFHSPHGPLDQNFRVPAHEKRETSALPYAIPSPNPTQVGCAPTVLLVGSWPAFPSLEPDQGPSLDAYLIHLILGRGRMQTKHNLARSSLNLNS